MLLLNPSAEVCSPRGASSPQLTPKSPGSPYFAYNPDTFDQMKYRDLQSLAKKLNLGGKGTRESLIEKLTAWHTKTIIHQDRSAPIQNFTMVPAIVKGASPRLLSPLTKKPVRNVDGTPRGILSPLKRARSWLNMQTEQQTTTEGVVPVVKEEPEEETEVCAKKPRKSISFSVYNGVRLISPRRQEASPMQMPFIEAESDPDSLDFTGSSPFDDEPPKLSSPQSQLYKPSVPESRTPLQAVQRLVSFPLRLPSLISSFLSPSSASASVSTSSSSSPSRSASTSSSSQYSLPSLDPTTTLPSLLSSEHDALPYPMCQTTIETHSAPADSVSASIATETKQSPSASALATNDSMITHSSSFPTATATTIIISPSKENSTTTPSTLVCSSASTPALASVIESPASDKSVILQEKWSAKERRTRRCSFGEGAADKANRLARASVQKPSRVSLPVAERPKRRRSSLA